MWCFQGWKWGGMGWYAIPACTFSTGLMHTATSFPRNTIPVCGRANADQNAYLIILKLLQQCHHSRHRERDFRLAPCRNHLSAGLCGSRGRSSQRYPRHTSWIFGGTRGQGMDTKGWKERAWRKKGRKEKEKGWKEREGKGSEGKGRG